VLGPEHSQKLAIADGTQARRDEDSRTVGCESLCGFHPNSGADSNENGVGEPYGGALNARLALIWPQAHQPQSQWEGAVPAG